MRAYTPFVHPNIVAFSQQLPRAMRLTTRSRPVLKMLCDELVHPDVARWEKLGFPVPWPDWLHTHLRELVGTPSDYQQLAPLLPPQFVALAFALSDHEALWTLMTLRLLMQELRISPTLARGERS